MYYMTNFEYLFISIFDYLPEVDKNNQKSMSDEEELPLHDIASSVGFSKAPSSPVVFILLLCLLLFDKSCF